MLNVYKNFFAAALAQSVLEGESARDFLARHNLSHTRIINITPDQSHPGYYNIPVYSGKAGRFVNVFKVPENPKPALKERLQHLLRTRKGYGAGDIFVSPWGRFLVTDVMGLKEV